MKCVFMRVKGNYLLPVDPYAEQLVERLKMGEEGVTVEATKKRNIGFHRKFFKLLQLGFEMWEPIGNTYDTESETWHPTITKNFESFREDVLVSAGHYDQVFTLNGQGFKLKAKSISFANCDDYEFERVYQSVLNVIWDKVLRHTGFKTQEAVDEMVFKLLRFE